MSHFQLTQIKRIEIAVLLRASLSRRAIATQIGCHHSTVVRELRRHAWLNASGYDAGRARLRLKQKRHLANQHRRKLPSDKKLTALIIGKLAADWSPEQIAGWLENKGGSVCAQTVYNFISAYRPQLRLHLHCRKGKYRRSRANAVRQAARDKLKAGPPHLSAPQAR